MIDDRKLLEALGQLAREGADRPLDDARAAAGEGRLVGAVSAGKARPSQAARLLRQTGVRPIWASAAVAAIAASVAFFVWPAAHLEVTLDGHALATGSYVRADAPGGARIQFSDGSEIHVANGSSARVEQLTEKGARLRLEDGAVDVQIIHTAKASWSLDAGPFVVAVTGTRFSAEWSTSEQALTVSLREGSVTVRGPLAPEGVTLHPGQTLRANLERQELAITREESPSGTGSAADGSAADGSAADGSAADGAPETAGSASIEGATTSADPDPGDRSGLGSTAVTPPDGTVPWSTRVAAGDFEGVLRDAEQRGTAGVLAGGSLDDLVALSDAARYGGRPDLSRECLLAIRKRFAGSGPATSAAFLIGRMAHDGGSAAGAVEWYDRYLAEAPGGTFASEALGRKMLAVRSTQGDVAAKPIAQAYLKRFPKGGFAAVAADIIGAKP